MLPRDASVASVGGHHDHDEEEANMSDTQQTPNTPQAPKPPESASAPKPAPPSPTLFTVPFSGGGAAVGIDTPAKDKVEPRVNVSFNGGGEFGASVLLDARKKTIESYGASTRIELGDNAATTISVRALPEKDAIQYGVQLKVDKPKLDADFTAETSAKGTDYKIGAKLPINENLTISGKGSIGSNTGGEGTITFTHPDGVKATATAGVDEKRGVFVQGAVTINLDHAPKTGPDANRAALSQLSPQDRALYEQAATAVRKYNESGQPRLPEQETAAALAALAKQEGLTRIDHVIAGRASDLDGRQTIFAVQGHPQDESSRKVYADRDVLANTPVETSVKALTQTPEPQEQSPAQKPLQR
jgi:hypothetical protein